MAGGGSDVLAARDDWFHRIRIGICTIQCMSALSICIYWLWWNSTDDIMITMQYVYSIICMSSLAELSVRAATLWFLRTDRTLPLWSLNIAILRWLARQSLYHRTIHNTIVIPTLIISLILAWIWNPSWLWITFPLWLLLSLIDLWYYDSHSLFNSPSV
jgi:hypothetical protein